MKPLHSSSILQELILSTFFLLAFIISLAIFFNPDIYYVLLRQDKDDYPTNYSVSAPEKTREKLPFAIGEGDKKCNIFNGSWVQDYSRPLYEEWECPFLGGDVTCLKNGRPDKDFRHWRWQPHGCSIPSFNATLMLESLRGKKMMFVGDSLNRNQFISMICLLHKNISKHATSTKRVDSSTIFTLKDYNTTIEFYWAPFLLESNADDPKKHRVEDRIVRNGSMDKHGEHWKGADIIVFNTYIWWIAKLRVLRGSFDDEVKDIVKIPMHDAFRIAMKSLLKWMKENIDPKKTRILFVSLSPTHQGSNRWHGDPNGNCYNETTMIQDPTYFAANIGLMNVMSEEFSKSIVPISFLNITQLSSSRKDAHTSIYKKLYDPLTPEQIANPKSYADCIHWCLPGVPDTWNELLYSQLFYP